VGKVKDEARAVRDQAHEKKIEHDKRVENRRDDVA
jgi:hypothetical protein